MRTVLRFSMGWAVMTIFGALMAFSAWLAGKAFVDMPEVMVWAICLLTLFGGGWGLAEALNGKRDA